MRDNGPPVDVRLRVGSAALGRAASVAHPVFRGGPGLDLVVLLVRRAAVGCGAEAVLAGADVTEVARQAGNMFS